MKVTRARESSMAEYNRLLKKPPPGPLVPMKPRRKGVYEQPGKSTASIVRHDDRCSGIRTAVELLGGMNPLVKDVEGEILIKPNCNTDDPYPRGHPPRHYEP